MQSYYSSGSSRAADHHLELKKRVVIDGVVFEFEEGGTKLKRMDDMSPARAATAETAAGSTSTPTRHTLSMSGHQYLRTKSGNLIAAEKVRRRKSAGGERKAWVSIWGWMGSRFSSSHLAFLCALDRRRSTSLVATLQRLVSSASGPHRALAQSIHHWQPGRCKRAATCPFQHDPTRLAICSKFLRGNCPHTAATCAVSHSPSPNNTPSCQHFQRTGECRNGQACLYPHVRVADDAPVCEDFAVEGWCDLGDACGERHAWECREFNETGQCKRGARCGLLHILRAKKGVAGENDVAEADVKEEDAGEAADELQTRDEIEAQQDFIQFRMGSDEGSDDDETGEGDEDDSSVHSDDEEKSSENELSFMI